MSDNLVIVFAKNIILGKVKTRLAKTVGDNAAFDVYKHLIDITERETLRLKNCDVHVYFSDAVINAKWLNNDKFVQEGENLGERMKHAFKQSFERGYRHVIGVGSDLPDLTAEIMIEALDKLKTNDTVFGPSEDGGYYIIGMNKLIPQLFENKSWSTDVLLDQTTEELNVLNFSTALLKPLNDVDTLEDLQNSSIRAKFRHL